LLEILRIRLNIISHPYYLLLPIYYHPTLLIFHHHYKTKWLLFYLFYFHVDNFKNIQKVIENFLNFNQTFYYIKCIYHYTYHLLLHHSCSRYWQLNLCTKCQFNWTKKYIDLYFYLKLLYLYKLTYYNM